MNRQPQPPQLPDTLDLQQMISSPEALACLSVESAKRLGVLPVAIRCLPQGETLLIGCADVCDTTQQERVANYIRSEYALQFTQCAAHGLSNAIDDCYRMHETYSRVVDGTEKGDWRNLDVKSAPEFPIELVNALIRQAVRLQASDIHLSPECNCVRIRLRIDGVLRDHAVVDRPLFNSMLSRIKIMALLDIAETRYPQDGQFRRLVDAQAIDLRASTFPTVEGENIVLRLIDSARKLNCLSALSLPGKLTRRLSALMRQPDGLIVVCGPTGAGKSTTLFALLNQIDVNACSVMTLEDPVEHRIDGIRQTTIDASRQWGYAEGVRALLRQDPDVLLIGEIRDSQSCAMALRAVSTGHQVLTTVHASCTHSALQRLRELDASGDALALGLVAVVAQRLLRRICKRCDGDGPTCDLCHGTGYYGRQVVMEVLEVNSEIRTLIACNAELETIRKVSEVSGFEGMQKMAMALVESGETTIEEVERVLGMPA